MMRIWNSKFWNVTVVLFLALSLIAIPVMAQQGTTQGQQAQQTPTPGSQDGQASQPGGQQSNQGQYDRIEIEINSGGVEGPQALPFGTVILWVTNSDTVAHNFRINGPGVERQFLSPIQPGATKTLRVEILQGTYTLSTVDDGGASGMSTDVPVVMQPGTSTTENQQDGQQGQQAQQTATPSEQQNQQDDQQQATPTPDGQQGEQQATPTQTGQQNQQGDQGQAGGGEQLVEQGEQVFSNNCARCHGQEGQGQVGPALAGNQFVTSEDPAQVIQTVHDGRGSMPAFGDQLDDQQLAAVVSYIRNAWGNSASTVSPEQASGGQQQGQQGDQNQGQQATATPTGTGGGQDQQGGQQGDQGQQAQQQTPTPTGQQQDDQGVPVTGPNQGYSVAPQVAKPDQSGQLNMDIALVKVADGFIDPINVVAAPDDSGRLFVVERNGVVRVVQSDGTVLDEPFLDISDKTLTAFLEQGLYDLEFHPDFADNGKFYVHFAELLRNGDSMIVEYSVSADNPDTANPDSARTIMQIDQPWANHNGGELAFGPDGYLYIGSGDGGWEGDPLEAGQDLSTLLGKLLRIDVNTDGTRPYTIPPDNPFASEVGLVQLFDVTEEEFSNIHTQARPEIWAYGLRNPWKFQFDPGTGDLYLPDVGQNHWEEINFQPAGSQGGENYGWDFLMGSFCFPINEESCQPIGVLPVAEYSHDLGNAVVGVGVYRGEQFADMDGIYFVADWGSGRIWGLQQAGGNQSQSGDSQQGESNNQQNQGDQNQSGQQQGNQSSGQWTFAELLDSDLKITGSGQDQDGNLYVTSCNCEYGGPAPTDNPPGALWRIVPADQVPDGAETAPSAGQAGDGQSGQQGQQQATPTPEGQQGQGEQQATPTPTPGDQQGQGQGIPQTGQQGEQRATPTPTGQQGGQQQGGQQGQQAQQTATSTPSGQGGGQPSDEGTVRAPLENQQPIGLEVVAEGLTAPVFLTSANDDSGRLFIVDQIGQIRIVDQNGNLLDEPFLDVSDRMVELREDFDERGLLGLAFHPDYANNGRLFVYYSAPLRESAPDGWNHTGHISEFAVSQADPNKADPKSERILIEVDEPQFNHDGGTVMFGPDGYLYISLGDGGAADDAALGHVEDWYEVNEGGNGQDVSNNLLGSILRIDIDSQGTGDRLYGIPADNPFASQGGDQNGLPEIYAYGFRNPYRFSFDRGGQNQLFAADVGQNAFEEVNIVELGGNYGWNVKEGTHCFSTEHPDRPLDTCPDTDPQGNLLIDPVIEYVNNNQEDGIGISVTGGFVYRGNQLQDVQGNYIFGDWSASTENPRGRLFMSEPQEQGLWPIIELVPQGVEFNTYLLGFGEDADGELYITTSETTGPTGSTGQVFRLVPPQQTGSTQEPPQMTATPTQQGEQGGQQQGGQQLIQQGEQVFGNICAQCHGENGEGLVGPALAGNSFVTSDDPSQVIDIVLHGSGQMPAFEDQLDEQQLAGVISFIRNAWGNNASTVSPEQISGGQGQQGGQQQSDQQAQQTPTLESSGQIPETGGDQQSSGPSNQQGGQSTGGQGEQQAGQQEQAQGNEPGTGQDQQQADQPVDINRLAMEGGELYGTICTACHMPGGVGTGPYPPLNGNVFVTSDDPQPLANVVLTGRAGMPAFLGDLTEREIAAILTFIRTAWDNNASPVTVEQVEQIQQQIETEREQSVPNDSGEGGNIGH